MDNVQPGILAPVPRLARYLTFSLKPGSAPCQSLHALTDLADGNKAVVGVGYPTKKNGRRRRWHHRGLAHCKIIPMVSWGRQAQD